MRDPIPPRGDEREQKDRGNLGLPVIAIGLAAALGAAHLYLGEKGEETVIAIAEQRFTIEMEQSERKDDPIARAVLRGAHDCVGDRAEQVLPATWNLVDRAQIAADIGDARVDHANALFQHCNEHLESYLDINEGSP